MPNEINVSIHFMLVFLLLGMGDRGQFRSKDPVKIFEIRVEWFFFGEVYIAIIFIAFILWLVEFMSISMMFGTLCPFHWCMTLYVHFTDVWHFSTYTCSTFHQTPVKIVDSYLESKLTCDGHVQISKNFNPKSFPRAFWMIKY